MSEHLEEMIIKLKERNLELNQKLYTYIEENMLLKSNNEELMLEIRSLVKIIKNQTEAQND